MTRIPIVFLICLLFYACSKPGAPVIEKKLPAPSHNKFDKISIKKVFSIDLARGGICIPTPQGVLILEALSSDGNRSALKSFNLEGELEKEKIIKREEGPDGINIMTECFTVDDKILFIDNNTYLKIIDPYDLGIKTIEKLSNKIDGYFTKFVFGVSSGTDYEYFNNQTITTFEVNNGADNNLNYFIVSYYGNFDRFRIICEARRKFLKTWEISRKSRGKELFLDYDNLMKLRRNIAVDWKNSFVYFLTDCEKPVISRLDFNGKHLTDIFLAFDSKKFAADKNKIAAWYRWALGDSTKIPLKKYKCIYPENSLAIIDINVLGNWLLVTTGKRNWDTFENEVLVYRLSDLSFLGTFFIPSGDWPSYKFGRFFVTKRIIEKDDDFFCRLNCYEMWIK